MDLTSLIASRRPGHTLPQAFYDDDEVCQADMAGMWQKSGLFEGHASDVPNPGDFFTVDALVRWSLNGIA